jgi:hypothetical protein
MMQWDEPVRPTAAPSRVNPKFTVIADPCQSLAHAVASDLSAGIGYSPIVAAQVGINHVPKCVRADRSGAFGDLERRARTKVIGSDKMEEIALAAAGADDAFISPMAIQQSTRHVRFALAFTAVISPKPRRKPSGHGIRRCDRS